MKIIGFTINRPTPSLNEIVNKHNRWAYVAMANFWKKQIRMAAPGESFNKPVLTIIRYSRSRAGLDDDNFRGGFKPVIDAMRKCGLIKNDDPAHLIHGKHRQEFDFYRPRTEITLEETECSLF